MRRSVDVERLSEEPDHPLVPSGRRRRAERGSHLDTFMLIDAQSDNKCEIQRVVLILNMQLSDYEDQTEDEYNNEDDFRERSKPS